MDETTLQNERRDSSATITHSADNVSTNSGTESAKETPSLHMISIEKEENKIDTNVNGANYLSSSAESSQSSLDMINEQLGKSFDETEDVAKFSSSSNTTQAWVKRNLHIN